MSEPHPALLSLIAHGTSGGSPLVTPALASSAIEHGVAPLVDAETHRALPDSDHDALVALAVHSLASASTTTAARRALRSLLQSAESLGIELAVFKGLAIGSRWYARPELRPAADVDVFAAPHDLARLGELVELLTDEIESGSAVDSMVTEGRVFEYTVVVGGVEVDVHLDPMNFVVPPRQRDLIWQRTESMILPDGTDVRVLDLELSTIQALLHLFRDNFADLLHLNDIALMMDARPDWHFIASFAEAEGWTDLIRFSLGYVCGVLDRPSPLPTELSPTSRLLISVIWPDRVRLQGRRSIVKAARRQSLASYLIRGRRIEVTRAMARRLFPPRIVIDDRFPGCDCPYLIALIRWRLAQRAQIRQSRADLPAEVSLATV